jgi:hypothetical protein
VIGEDDALSESEGANLLEDGLIEPSTTAGDDEADFRMPRPERRVGLHEGRVVLPGFDRADRQDEAFWQRVPTSDADDVVGRHIRPEPGLDPFGDHHDLLRIDRVGAKGVAARALRDGDDAIGAAEETRHHRAEIETVPRQVVLRERQVRDVVEREHAASAGQLREEVICRVEETDAGEDPIEGRATEVRGSCPQPPPLGGEPSGDRRQLVEG